MNAGMNATMSAAAGSPDHDLAEEVSCAGELTACLEQEQRQLAAMDTAESLHQTIVAKNVLVAKMSTLAERRHKALAAQGLPASEAGMRVWLEKSSAASPLWNALLDCARRARELNQTNGMLINTHMARTRAALSVLQQKPAGSTVYGPDGQQDMRGGSRTRVVG
jgi:flagella synthesis protein FlgN